MTLYVGSNAVSNVYLGSTAYAGAYLGTSPASGLGYNAVLKLIGDSNTTGSADTSDQAAAVAAYVVNPNILCLNTSGAWVTYTPGTVTGMNNWANTPQIGPEIGFIERFVAKYPNDKLYILKMGRAGGFITRGPISGTAVGSIATNIFTLSSGTLASNELLVGQTNPIILGTIVNSLQGGNNYFLSKIGQTANTSQTVASQTVDKYSAPSSFSPDEGTLWSGLAGSITNGYRQRSVTGYGLVPGDKKIVATWLQLGTNDKAQTSLVYNRLQNDTQVLIAAMKSNWSIPANVPVQVARVRGADAGSLAVRSQQAAVVTADPQTVLVDLDPRTVWDGTHFTIAEQRIIGSDMFDRAVF